MGDLKLGKLEKMDLREIWANESADFTPWLAQDANLRLLGETVGIDLEPEDSEVEVGRYYADIRCRNTADDTWVIIENQIAKTDHCHLGQTLTYAAGLDAKTIVWVAQQFTDEHRAALDWLNENTAEDISFFGLEIEVWRIGASDPAPKFNIVSKPNDWSRDVKGAAGSASEPSDRKIFRKEFWTAFKGWVESTTDLRLQKATHQHWLSMTIGRSYFHVNAIVSYWNSATSTYAPELRVELILNSPETKRLFDQLLQHREEIERRIDAPLTWHNPPESKSAKVYVRIDSDFSDKAKWPEQFQWLARYLHLFRETFTPIVRTL